MVLNSEDIQAVRLRRQQFVDSEQRRLDVNLDDEDQENMDLV